MSRFSRQQEAKHGSIETFKDLGYVDNHGNIQPEHVDLMMHHIIKCILSLIDVVMCFYRKEFKKSNLSVNLFFRYLSLLSDVKLISKIDGRSLRWSVNSFTITLLRKSHSFHQFPSIYWVIACSKYISNDEFERYLMIDYGPNAIPLNLWRLSVSLSLNFSRNTWLSLLKQFPRLAFIEDCGAVLLRYIAEETTDVQIAQLLIQQNPAVLASLDSDSPLSRFLLKNQETKNRYEMFRCLVDADTSNQLVKTVFYRTDFYEAGVTNLHFACQSSFNHYNVLIDLIAIFPDALRIQDGDGKLPLHHLCENPNRKDLLSCLRLLLKGYPFAITVEDNEGNLPGYLLVQNSDNLSAVEYIIGLFPEVMDVVPDNYDDFHILACARTVDICRFLLTNYPQSARLESELGRLALHSCAASMTDVNIVRLIYEAYPEAISHLDIHGNTVLNWANWEMSSYVFLYLVQVYPEALMIVNIDGQTPYSNNYNFPDNVKRIILRINPTLDIVEYRRINYEARRIALHLAYSTVENGRSNIMRRLMDHGGVLHREVISFL